MKVSTILLFFVHHICLQRIFPIFDKGAYLLQPGILVGSATLAPRRAKPIVETLAILQPTLYADSIAHYALLAVPCILQHASAVNAIGEDCSHIYLDIMARRGVGGVAIGYVVLRQRDVGRIVGVYHKATCHIHRLRESVVPHCHMIEECALVE